MIWQLCEWDWKFYGLLFFAVAIGYLLRMAVEQIKIIWRLK